jgi:transposase-like protein
VSKNTKKYTEEYKTSAIKMVLEKGKALTEVAQNLGIPVIANAQ